MSVFSVIDVGTNTFHLLVARFDDGGGLQTLHRERRFVKLAEGGIERIRPAAMRRGLDALTHFGGVLARWQAPRAPDLVPARRLLPRQRVVGTAALRTAANGPAFIEQVQLETGLRIETVSGDEEARLIHRGVSLAVPFDRRYRLIVDLGGGSVECILANDREVAWAASFPIGLAVLHHRFHTHDPMPAEAVRAMESWLEEQLRPLDDAVRRFPPVDLIGASGTFDVLSATLGAGNRSLAAGELGLVQIETMLQRLAGTTTRQRLAMPEIPDDRADLFTLALRLIVHLGRRTGLARVTHSSYAMKEGILRELAEASGLLSRDRPSRPSGSPGAGA